MSNMPPAPSPKGMPSGTYATTPFGSAPPPLPPPLGPSGVGPHGAPPQGSGQSQWSQYDPAAPGSAPFTASQGQHAGGPSAPYPTARPGSDKLVYPKVPPTSPVLAAVLSAVVVGLGQIVLGQTLKGLVLLVGSIALGIASAGLLAPVVWILAIVDAYLIGQKLKAGQPVAEWEFF